MRKTVQVIAEDRRGNVAMIFALCAFVVVGSVGAAIDYSRALSVKGSLQGSLDAAVLAASQQDTVDAAAVDSTVQQFFAAEPKMKHGATQLVVKGGVVDNNTVTGEANATVPVLILGVLGFNGLDVSVKTQVSRGLGNVEVALVLDTTLSMAAVPPATTGRLDVLKTAANELIDTIYALPGASDKIKVGLVPFSSYVNVGMGNRNASWMNVPPDSTVTKNECWDTYPNATKSNCRIVKVPAVVNDVPTMVDQEQCDWNYGTAVNVCGPITTTLKWNGCAGARNKPLNVKDEAYFTRIPGVMNVSCPSPLMPLTKTPAAIKSSINAMFAQGDTYIPSGLVWGWRLLSNKAPFTESADDPQTANGRVRKYIVLMTDGVNTKSPNYASGDHEGYDSGESDKLTREVCKNIRDDNIEIFSIAFQVTDTKIKKILEECATPGGAFFDAVDYSKLLTAFSTIGGSLAIARISQ